MKVVFLKNDNKEYISNQISGFEFKPRNKISSLVVFNNSLLSAILLKKIIREINKISYAVNLIIKSDVAIENDCNIMIDEIIRVSYKLETKYMKYFNEFEYFECVKDLYFLYQSITCKKKLLRGIYEKNNNI